MRNFVRKSLSRVTVAAAVVASAVVMAPTASAAACASPGQKLVNAGFESGTSGWSGANWSIHTWTGVAAPRTGSWSSFLGGTAAPTVESLRQTVTVPAGCTASTLSLWVKIDTDEGQSRAWDTLTIKAGSTTLGRVSNVDAGGYRQLTYSVGSFAGQSVTVSFTSREDIDVQTSFILDDIALTAA